jgi:hypothetical protein
MGIENVITDNVDLSHLAIGFEPSITDGLRVWHWTFGDAGRARKNQWTGPGAVGDATPVGTPVYNAASVRTQTNSNYLDTAWLDTDTECTMLVVASTPETVSGAAGRAAICGQLSGSGATLKGIALQFNAPFGVQALMAGLNPGTSAPATQSLSLTVASIATPSLYAVRYRAGELRVDNLTAGTNAVLASYPRIPSTALSHRIGDIRYAGNTGRGDEMMFAGYGRYLPDAELTVLANDDIRPMATFLGLAP